MDYGEIFWFGGSVGPVACGVWDWDVVEHISLYINIRLRLYFYCIYIYIIYIYIYIYNYIYVLLYNRITYRVNPIQYTIHKHQLRASRA